MVVTDIKEYRKGKYEIYLNDAFAFVLYKSEIKQYGIEKDHELSDNSYEDILKVLLPKRAKKRAMNLLLKNDLTEKKLREKLTENKYPTQCIEEAIDYVKSYHYIDDRRYAHGFIASKAQSTSKSVIRNKLIEKGISKDIIDSELNEFYEDDPLNSGVEEELIKKLLIKKCHGRFDLEYEERQKIFASIYRKGFSLDKVSKIFDEIRNESGI